MNWISKTIFISLYFLPVVFLFEYINPFSSFTRISEASAFILAIGIVNIIFLRYVRIINIDTRFLVCVISIFIYNYMLVHLLIDKYVSVFGRDWYVYFTVLVLLNIAFFGIYKSYFLAMYGGADALLKKIWYGKLRTGYVVGSAATMLIASFIFTLWLGNILNENSAMKFFHYFAYGRDKLFNLNVWFVQPPFIISVTVYILLQIRAFSGPKDIDSCRDPEG